MELLIALLIAFGATTSEEEAARFVTEDSVAVKEIIYSKGITEESYKKKQEELSIIGLEESDI
jgi:hypothetical protein